MIQNEELKDTKIVRITGIRPGCIVKANVEGKVVVGTVKAIIKVGKEKKLLCRFKSQYLELPESSCQLHAAYSGVQLLDTRGRVIGQ